MATEARRRRYREKRNQFAEKLRTRGRVVSFGVRGSDGDDFDPSDRYREIGTASIFPSKWRQDFSNDVRMDDRMFFVSALIDISQCRIMKDNDGCEYNIEHVEPFKPDDEVIYNEIQVRG